MIFLPLFGAASKNGGNKIILHKAKEGGYWAEVSALPGCASQGETKKETLANIKEAIGLHMKHARV
mgnify:CR=1 FL=1